MRFEELRLAEPIVRAIASRGYARPTPIQREAIPRALAGRDVLGCAQTGTGKTGAFALPILHRLAAPNAGPRTRHRKRPRGRSPRALVLCPTRELAGQILASFAAYGRNLTLRHAAVFGGVSQVPQVRLLRAGIDVLVATPGRLLDLINQRVVDLRGIEVLVLDEADRMLDMGFIRDIRKVVERLPARRQTLLFSATMPAEIRSLASSILREPVFMQVTPVASTVEAICQSVYLVAKKDKPALLGRLLRDEFMTRTLIFTRTKYGADRVARNLRRLGIEAAAIHGNKSQGARTRVLNEFRSGGLPVLVATDIASRGIDVDGVSHVVNFDMPDVPETYVHRIGRTARAGASGIAISLCDREEQGHLRAIEQLTRTSLEVVEDRADLDPGGAPRPQRQPKSSRPRKTAGHRRRKPERADGAASRGRRPTLRAAR